LVLTRQAGRFSKRILKDRDVPLDGRAVIVENQARPLWAM
jgi:hypothetical protein